jgi:pyruvate/oxaloacetate carboxyltransferase
MNVLAGERYKIVSKEVKDYVKGFYGRTPAPVKPEIRQKIIGAEKGITCRPADLIPPELEKLRRELLAEFGESMPLTEEDLLSYALYPDVARGFFRERSAAKGKVLAPQHVAALAAAAAWTIMQSAAAGAIAAEPEEGIVPPYPKVSPWALAGRQELMRGIGPR